ncbi:hypothetical protein M9H77_04893 [Catharanthus roseus]|uniref:Uncharacterized protein n=1 Tax=Catharanthus roseus TaxID=4058 RepID=A0ACC0CFI4_CATRO|nr:hypothetical protein M9H77_04893 [Catharanthus roseus]
MAESDFCGNIGYHFVPTDVEMLMLLRRRVEGMNICSRVIERDMYGETATPWLIFRGDDPWETVGDIDSNKSTKDMKTLYVITKLKKIGNLKTIRVAGCGTWDGQTGKTYIKMNNKKIGYKRMFNFKASKKMEGAANKSSDNWIMHEYHLDGEFLMKGNCDDYVICRIKKLSNAKFSERSSVGYSTPEESSSRDHINNEEVPMNMSIVGGGGIVEENQVHEECYDVSSRDIGGGGSISKVGSNKRKYCEASFDDDQLQESKQLCKHQRVMAEAAFHDNQELMKEELCKQQDDEWMNMIDWNNIDPCVGNSNTNSIPPTSDDIERLGRDQFDKEEWSAEEIEQMRIYLDNLEEETTAIDHPIEEMEQQQQQINEDHDHQKKLGTDQQFEEDDQLEEWSDEDIQKLMTSLEN